MRFPLHVATDMMRWQLKNWWVGNKRVPLVLMLEPLHTCNLACVGCSPERYSGDLRDRLPLSKCFEAVDTCGTPMVSVCGGEPTVYPEIVELVEGLIARRRHVILCTNAILLDRFYRKARPHKRIAVNVHLDGMRETHDFVVDRPGIFDRAIELDVDGILLSPGYHYEAIEGDDHFLFREEIHEKFKHILALTERYPKISSTPLFLQFAAGLRDYPCTPWGNPTYTPQGWKGPCYLIGEKYYGSWTEFFGGVDWDYWESRQDPRCHNCKMHSGFEPSVVRKLGESLSDVVTMARWQLASVRNRKSRVAA